MRKSEAVHNWISIPDDPHDTTWMFDTTFMLSNLACIYGAGCPSIDTEPDPTETLGCCTHGAHFVDKADRRSVLDAVDRLTDDEWQFRAKADAAGGPLRKKKGAWQTRKVDGACIFLNRSDFAGGAGCALHLGALRHNERPLDWKPDVCWQVPIHLDIHEDEYGHETVMIRGWKRRDWGPGGDDFHWWCVESEAAYVGARPVYLQFEDELVEMVGRDIYDRVAAELAALATADNATFVKLSATRS